jgi:hypothetical protein
MTTPSTIWPDAIKAIEAHRFPVMWSEMTLSYFQKVGEQDRR